MDYGGDHNIGGKMEILRCEGVSKVYGSGDNQVIALDQIDLSVEKGGIRSGHGGVGFRQIYAAAYSRQCR